MNIAPENNAAWTRSARARRNLGVIAALVIAPKCTWCVLVYVGAVIGSRSAPELCGDVATTANHATAPTAGLVVFAAAVIVWCRCGLRRHRAISFLSRPTSP